MQTSLPPAVDGIDSAVLTPVVRQALQRSEARILDWRMEQIGGGVGNPVSAGLFRFAGSAQDELGQVNWSVVLKVIQSPANLGWKNLGEGDDQSHWNYWKREPLVYQSGLLDALPTGLSAPHCWGVSEPPGNFTWLWLEDITDAYAGSWTLERYALTARQLGQLNGLYSAERPLPNIAWFSKERMRQWLDMLPWKGIPWEHPLVLARYPRPEDNAFRRMLAENSRFLARLDLLPLTISHGDTYPTNFKARLSSSGVDETVALDWALMGSAPLGDDWGQFVFGAQTNLPNAKPADVDTALFEAYLAGLRESGCRADARLVRFGCTALAALRVGLFQIFLISEALRQPDAIEGSTPTPDARPAAFEVVMAEEAYRLLEALDVPIPDVNLRS